MPTYFPPGGGSVHFEEANPTGSPPVVLLHGLGSAGEDWRLQFEPLAGLGFRVLAPDMPGFGWSPWPGGKVSVERMADLVAQFMEGVGASPAHVVGISMGGTVALQLALDHPDRVRSLVLVNTFAHLRPRNPGEWLYFLARVLIARLIGPERQADMVARRILPRPEHEPFREILRRHIIQADKAVYRGMMSALFRYDARARLKEIRVPTLVITGSADTTVAPVVQEELARGIPHARHVVIEGAGHAVIIDTPEKFNETLVSFYRELEQQPAGSSGEESA